MAEEKKDSGSNKPQNAAAVKLLMVYTNTSALGDTGKKTGWYLPEAAHAYYVFKRHQFQITAVSVNGGLSLADPSGVKAFEADPVCKQFREEFMDKDDKIETISITALQAHQYQAIYFVGGAGAMWDFDDKFLKSAAEKIYNEGGIVSAVCHGSIALAYLEDGQGNALIKGKKVAGFSNAEEEASGLTKVVPMLLEDVVVAKGAEFVKAAALWGECAVRDGRLISGQNPASATATARHVVQAVYSEVLGVTMAPKKVLLVVSSHNRLGKEQTDKATGWYISEVAHPYEYFKDFDFNIVFASPRGGLADVDPSSMQAYGKDGECMAFAASHTVDGKLETIAVSALGFDDTDIVFYAGGHGTMWDFRSDTTLKRATEKIYGQGGIVGAVCHGVAALLEAEVDGVALVKGKTVTGFSNAEEDAVQMSGTMPYLLETELAKKGAKFVKADALWASKAVIDQRIVTGQNPASATDTARLIVKEALKF